MGGVHCRNSIGVQGYRGTLLIRNCLLIGPYSRPMPRARWSKGGGQFLMSEVPLYLAHNTTPPPLEDFRRALDIGLLKGRRGGRLLMSEVPM